MIGRVFVALALLGSAAASADPTFNLSVYPSSLSVGQGSATSATALAIASAPGYSFVVFLSANGLPQGATATFSPPQIPEPGSGSSLLTIQTLPTTPVGTYALTVTGKWLDLSVTVNLSLVVNNGQGGATVTRMVPILLDAGGVPPSRFSSELTLANRGGTAAKLTLTYTAATVLGATGSGAVTESLAAGQQKVIPDAIAYLRARGLAIPTTGSQGGTLLVKFEGLASAESSFAGARTTSPSGNGRAGLSYPAIRPEDGFSSDAWVYGLREDAADRSNLALVNLGTLSPITLRVYVWNADGSGFDILRPDVVLGPGQWTQISRILGSVGFRAGEAHVHLQSGPGPFYTYGVFNDNATNDGSFVPPVPAAYPKESMVLPVLVEGATFTSELVLANYLSGYTNVSLAYTESASPSLGPGGTVTEVLGPYEQRIIPDALEYLRSRGLPIGPRGAAGYGGALTATFQVGVDVQGGFVGARTSAPAAAGGGRYGLFYAASALKNAATSEAWIYGLQQNATSRSNVAISVAGEPPGTHVFRYEVYDGDTGRVVRVSDPISLGPGGWHQVNGVLAGLGISNGYVRVLHTSGNEPFLAYGVVNDGETATSGRTNDGSYVAFSNR